MNESSVKTPKLIHALIPIIILVTLLLTNVNIYGDNTLAGSNQVALLIGGAVAAIVGFSLKIGWDTMLDGIVKSISSALGAVIILLLIGALSGTWLISGIVPSMVFYGLKILHPSIFLVATCIICALVSLATGSSWSTVATIGIALIGVGEALGFSTAVVAGAVISGSYFGDKMSPMSDTTNLAPAMAGTDLITHIKHMTWTTFPSISIALIIFLIMGFTGSSQADVNEINSILNAINEQIYVTPLVFLVPGVVIFLIVKKVPAIPALFVGTILGGIFAIIFQPDLIKTVSGESENFLLASYKSVIDAMTVDVGIQTSSEKVNELLSTSGMSGMLGTIWLIVCAMIFGGLMEITGLLKALTNSLLVFTKTVGSLIATTVMTCFGFNWLAADQYLAIVVPGRMFADVYRDKGIKPENLSRALEDSGTVTSVLVPWNTCGAYHSQILGVATGEYFFFCFFNWISPLMTMFYGFMGWKITKIEETNNLDENP